MQQQQFLSYEQVSVMFAVSPQTVRRWVDAGKFPAPLKIGGSCRFAAEQIDAWSRGRDVPAVAAPKNFEPEPTNLEGMFRAEYAACKSTMERFGLSEDDYIASRMQDAAAGQI